MARRGVLAATARRRKHSGFGNIRKLPSGRYQARYTAPNGSLISAPITFDTRMDAEAFQATQRADLVRGTWASPKAKPLTFGDYAERQLSQRELKPRTYAHYRTMLDKFRARVR